MPLCGVSYVLIKRIRIYVCMYMYDKLDYKNANKKFQLYKTGLPYSSVSILILLIV